MSKETADLLNSQAVNLDVLHVGFYYLFAPRQIEQSIHVIRCYRTCHPPGLFQQYPHSSLDQPGGLNMKLMIR